MTELLDQTPIAADRGHRRRVGAPASRTFWAGTLAAALCAAVLSLPAAPAPLKVGSTTPTLVLNDQHDRPVPVGPDTRWLVFAGEKPVSDFVTAVLAAEPAGIVERLRLVYVVDIVGMPAWVTQMFALPRLRELSFPIALVREPAQAALLAELPRHPGSATVLRLEDGRVVRVAAVRSAAELRSALGLAVAATAP
jgi:hypothetical protein